MATYADLTMMEDNAEAPEIRRAITNVGSSISSRCQMAVTRNTDLFGSFSKIVRWILDKTSLKIHMLSDFRLFLLDAIECENISDCNSDFSDKLKD
jgi:hypothetical protein